MASILLQAGHSAEYNPFLAGGGGAPAEADWTARFTRELGRLLTERGIKTTTLGSWMVGGAVTTPPATATIPYDLAIFCHYDANIYGIGGGFIDRYRPENYKGRPPTGQRDTEEHFMALFDAVYFPATHILNKPARRNANTWDYYAHRAMNTLTPRVIIEFGVGAPGAPDYDVLWGDLNNVALTLFGIIEENFIERELLPLSDPDLPPVNEDEDSMYSHLSPPLSRQQALDRLQQFGYVLPEGFAITERAIFSTVLNGGSEWRGPAISDEYPFEHADGHVTTRRDFTAGSIDYDAATGVANWAEVVKESRE